MPSVRWKSLPAHVKPAGDKNQPGFDAVSASWDTTAAKAKKPRAFKLKAPREKERPAQQSITKHLNSVIINGGAFHIANEGLFSFIQDESLRHKLWVAMKLDGVLPGAPDDAVLLGMDAEQTAAIRLLAMLADLRERVPEIGTEWEFIDKTLAMFIRGGCRIGFLEIKRPGWTLSGDKRWREGEQPKAHAWLAGFGAPVAIVRDVIEAEEAVLSWGARLRYRITKDADGEPAMPTDPPT